MLATVNGPGWSASVEIVELDDPLRSPALRTLFVNYARPGFADLVRQHTPNTQIALAYPRRATVSLPGGAVCEWRQLSAAPPSRTDTYDAVAEGLDDGDLSVLLLAPQAGVPGAPPVFTCLGGEMALDFLTPHDDALRRLFDALGLRLADDDRRFLVTAHGSGLSLYGRAALPWQPAADLFNLPFRFTPGLNGGESRLLVETERLADDERAALVAAWRALSAVINPRNPLTGSPQADGAPGWVTLEAADPLGLPDFYWAMAEGPGQRPVLRFAPGQVNLLISDRPLYDQENPPQTLARVALENITITPLPAVLTPTVRLNARPAPGTGPDNAPLTVLDPGNRLIPLEAPDVVQARVGQQGEWLQVQIPDGRVAFVAAWFVRVLETTDLQITVGAGTAVAGGQAAYTAGRSGGDSWQEGFSLAGLDVAFDPVETPRLLRRWQGQPTPEWIPSEATYDAISGRRKIPPPLWPVEAVGGPFVPPSDPAVDAPASALFYDLGAGGQFALIQRDDWHPGYGSPLIINGQWLDASPLPSESIRFTRVRWSPDGQSALFVAATPGASPGAATSDGLWHFWFGEDRRHETRQIIANGFEMAVHDAAWSPDGNVLLIRFAPGGVALVTPNLSPQQPFHRLPYPYATWSQDGSRALISGPGADGRPVIGWLRPDHAAADQLDVELLDGSAPEMPLWIEHAAELAAGRIAFIGTPYDPASGQRETRCSIYTLAEGRVTRSADLGPGPVRDALWNRTRTALIVHMADGRQLVVRVQAAQSQADEAEPSEPAAVAPDTVTPAVLWGFTPLHDGWAQFPVPNLTEQIYLDAELERAPGAALPPGLIQGAVVFGNADPAVLADHPGEQPWSMTLLNARRVNGQWTFIPDGAAGYHMESVRLEIGGPDLVLDGLFWLSTDRPTRANALPDFDNWSAALDSIALKSVSDAALFPPLVTLHLESFAFAPRGSHARLGGWALRYSIDAALFTLLRERGVLPREAFAAKPLAWRRHRTLPLIQNLPLTQNQSPPNTPSPSRQFVPFELPTEAAADDPAVILAGDWHIGVSDEHGAGHWPGLLSQAVLAAAFREAGDLGLASLTLPGVTLLPEPPAHPQLAAPLNGDATTLSLQYRYDLPYSDEINALAQLPRRRDADGDAPNIDGAPLDVDSFAAHWARLGEQAALAAADARDAFTIVDGEVHLASLVEPYLWQAAPQVSLAEYPGAITLLDENGQPYDDLATLRGVSGQFLPGAPGRLNRVSSGDNPFTLDAGSMAAHFAEDGSARDQRGLLRRGALLDGQAIRTRVTLDNGTATDVPYDLVTLRESLALASGDGTWAFWCRDLPVRADDSTFSRGRARSHKAQDVNDPLAQSRQHNYLSGYEWRLGDGTPTAYLPLCGLHFYPLTLERVEFDPATGQVERLEIVGRLQLPVSDPAPELTDLSSAIKVIFSGAGALTLTGIEMACPVGEWPLALRDGETTAAPHLLWEGISYNDGRIALQGARLKFYLFGVAWTHPLDDDTNALAFGPGQAEITLLDAVDPVGGQGTALRPQQVGLTITQAAAGPYFDCTVSVYLDVALGSLRQVDQPTRSRTIAQGESLSAIAAQEDVALLDIAAFSPGVSDPNRIAANTALTIPGEHQETFAPGFAATVRFDLPGETVTWTAGTLFEDLMLSGGEVNFAAQGLQFRWEGYTPPPGTDLQLLPGMHLADASRSPGYAALTLDVTATADGLPELRLRSALLEALLTCRWGAFRQDGGGDVFASSAGDLVAGYTSEWAREGWQQRLTLNGFLEVTNLISWPLSLLDSDPDDPTQLTLPTVDGALGHARHTIRLLLNQHAAPADLLTLSQDPALLFTLGAGLDTPWQFLAVVEHQLVDVADAAAPSPASDRRWTALQEVRLALPRRFKRFLLAHQNIETPNPNDPAEHGTLGDGARGLLAGALGALPDETLIVEASAPHWVRPAPLGEASLTALQYLPNGSQHAILSRPQDYAPDDSGWLLLTLPFLGRLQARTADSQGENALQADPVRLLRDGASSPLALALTSRRATATTLTLAIFDTALGRLVPRLDPATLEEHWFRLQNSPPEPPFSRVQGVLVARSDTPARLSRAAALRRAFDSFRPAYPPAAPEGFTAADDPDYLVWRQSSLLVLPAVSGPAQERAPGGWYVVAAALRGLRYDAQGSTTQRHVAATALPAQLESGEQANPRPVSFTVSPYLGLGFRPAGGNSARQLASVELLCLDTATRQMRPVASKLWEDHIDAQAVERWAAQARQDFAPRSPLAVLRTRSIFRLLDEGMQGIVAASDTLALLTTAYEFALLTTDDQAETLAQQVFHLRSAVDDLRFAEGQYNGKAMPEGARPFELAPPQTTDVQPLYLTERPGGVPAQAGPAWPWGFSALRVGVQYTGAAQGVVGSRDAATATHWWQAPQHAVQYRAANGNGSQAGLPAKFRAPAIKSLLPVVPDVRLPAIPPSEDGGSWQPVLPGAIRYLLLGARAGVLFALRNQLLTQRGAGPGSALVSGSVPVQHRAPRPVPLPANRPDSRDTALQPWASYFEPLKALHAGPTPVDETFFAASGDLPPRRLKVTLMAPLRGGFTRAWDGTLAFDVQVDNAAGGSDTLVIAALELTDGLHTFSYPLPAASTGRLTFMLAEAERKRLADVLASKAVGSGLAVAARVVEDPDPGTHFAQVLGFPLQLVDDTRLPLPLVPYFIHFEDPEYNRQLASSTASVTGMVKERVKLADDNFAMNLHAVALAADRQEYNADSRVTIRHDWDDDGTANRATRLTPIRIDAGAVATPLLIEGHEGLNGYTMQPGELAQFSLLRLKTPNGQYARFEPGDTLQIKLTVLKNAANETTPGIPEDADLFLNLTIVEAPVLPATPAAYALLRACTVDGRREVECVRFAWGPQPARVELICPDDLRTQVVRRRAVFQWSDVVRNGTLEGYAAQKITAAGSTHLPAAFIRDGD